MALWAGAQTQTVHINLELGLKATGFILTDCAYQDVPCRVSVAANGC